MLKFSVIIPVYNTEEYLCESISSVLQQTYPAYEVILVDDGSTDSSGDICDHYGSTFPNSVVVIHTNNQGQFHARIHGIEIAKGDVVCFLDSDDTWRIDTLEKLADVFTKHQCDVVLFEAQESKDFLSCPISITLADGVVLCEKTKASIYRKLISTQELNHVCLKAVRREYTYIPEDFFHLMKLMHGEDLLLSTQYLTVARKIVFLKEGLYHYRVRPGSVTHSFSLKRFESIKTVHEELDRYIDLWDMPELKPLHNTRKVIGCIETTISLLNNSEIMSHTELGDRLRSMSNDAYFKEAYQNMDSREIRHIYRVLAWCLYHERHTLLRILVRIKSIRLRIKRNLARKIHGGH